MTARKMYKVRLLGVFFPILYNVTIERHCCCMRVAEDGVRWRAIGEAYVQQCTAIDFFTPHLNLIFILLTPLSETVVFRIPK